ncbi:MAG: MarR family transcriptional regulator [Candidatus Bathyarchaeia archaeon]
MSKRLTEREAEYLRAVFDLLSKKSDVGSLDIANILGVSCATASKALKKLYKKGMLLRGAMEGCKSFRNGAQRS